MNLSCFGPLRTYDGGKEKVPAAICRKIALVEDGGKIEVWSDGKQTRSFCYINDCAEGLMRLMDSDFHDPLNLGQDRMLTIDELAYLVAEIASEEIRIHHELNCPLGVRGRNSDNSLLREVLKWEPSISLEEVLRINYEWVRGELIKTGRLKA